MDKTCAVIGCDTVEKCSKCEKMLEITLNLFIEKYRVRKFLFSSFDRNKKKNCKSNDLDDYKALIDKSDYCLFCFDELNQKVNDQIKSYYYAIENNKFAINIYPISQNIEFFAEIFCGINNN